MDSSRRVDIDRMSGRQNRIAGRGEILSQSWVKKNVFSLISIGFIDFH